MSRAALSRRWPSGGLDTTHLDGKPRDHVLPAVDVWPRSCCYPPLYADRSIGVGTLIRGSV